ncbi:hypothetical protein DPMN_175773 [Dreissena polymorpha]|uniref:Uncharacterized protein n=1 Tax=Dreissena polymorpha TaxID=45954 RepID=A0A9D4E752_DREPO|nr:hypothetical protein DPMN_175773 [Dreissena polymorpha]
MEYSEETPHGVFRGNSTWRTQRKLLMKYPEKAPQPGGNSTWSIWRKLYIEYPEETPHRVPGGNSTCPVWRFVTKLTCTRGGN